MIRSATASPPNGSNQPNRSSLVLLRRRQHLRRWRDRATPRSRHLADAVWRTEDTALVRVWQHAFEFLKLALAQATSVCVAAASWHIGTTDLHIALGTGPAHPHKVHHAHGYAFN